MARRSRVRRESLVMTPNKTSILITEGFSPGSPWLIEELNTSLKNYTVAVLSASQSTQSIALTTQNNVLVEQINKLEEMQDYAEMVGAGTETALVVDSSGKVLVDDPNIVSDLVGRSISSLSSSEVIRLVDFTTKLEGSAPPVNLGGQSYVSVNVQSGQPPVDGTISAPIRVWNSDPAGIPNADIQPFVCYAFQAQDGSVNYRMCDGNKKDFGILSVASLTRPDPKFVYDAYRVNTGTVENPIYKTFVPKDTASAFPLTETTDTLYRNVFTGELRLIGPSKPNITFASSSGFVVPSSNEEINFWFGQSASQRLTATAAKLLTYDVSMPVQPDTFQWKYKDFEGGGFSKYPPTQGLPSDTKLSIGSLVEDASTGKIYLISGRIAGVNKFVEVEKVGSPFVLKLSKDDSVTLRGEITEKITQATQRTTEQQLFLNSLIQKFNLYFDMATNVLKALTESDSRVSNSI